MILEELRDLRLEMRADRQRADEDRKRAEEDRKRTDEVWRRERQVSDRRFERLIRASARREAATHRAFKEIRTVGLVIARTLDHHTRILERIDKKLGAWRNGPARPGSGGRASA